MNVVTINTSNRLNNHWMLPLPIIVNLINYKEVSHIKKCRIFPPEEWFAGVTIDTRKITNHYLKTENWFYSKTQSS